MQNVKICISQTRMVVRNHLNLLLSANPYRVGSVILVMTRKLAVVTLDADFMVWCVFQNDSTCELVPQSCYDFSMRLQKTNAAFSWFCGRLRMASTGGVAIVELGRFESTRSRKVHRSSK
jgi:hypothetical protein